MGVPLLAMPARESRAEERVVGLKSTGITREGRLTQVEGLGGKRVRKRGEEKDGTLEFFRCLISLLSFLLKVISDGGTVYHVGDSSLECWPGAVLARRLVPRGPTAR